ncbi:DUF3828 domain-containing protein [Terricaulis sp.]|uniref:DUF3828 domain-containing protein n=1 Tax=Terricaulis sp. TaxID=2768686 RepID=UPI00378370D6
MRIERRTLILGMSAAALAACSRQNAKSKTGDTATTAGSAAGDAGDPAAIIRPLYAPYMTPGSTFPDFTSNPIWSDDLRAQLTAMTQRSEALNEPILDFDPIIGAQDYQLSNLNVANEAVVEHSSAVVRAGFTNLNQHTEIVYDLVWQHDAWKVDNIRGDGWDLRQIAALPRQP